MKSMTAEKRKEINLNSSDEVVIAVAEMIKLNPANRMAKYFPSDYFLGLPEDKQKHIVRIIRAGLMNNDSEVGAYAMETSDYDNFGPILHPIIRDYHGIDDGFNFHGDWDISGKNLNLKDIDPKLSEVSMRVRVARNVEGFPLTGNMTKEDRVRFENYMVEKVFTKLIKDSKYGGKYVECIFQKMNRKLCG